MLLRAARAATAGIGVLTVFLAGFVAVTGASFYLINQTAERIVAEDAERTSLT
jgi:energy-converting hydrogenase Eha subunit G